MNTLEQQRAAYAWTKIGPNPDEKFVNLAKGAPALVMTNGLLQFLGFLLAKGKDGKDKTQHYRDLAGIIMGWLHDRLIVSVDDRDAVRCVEALTKADARTYMRATDEALEILRWVRTFADARCKQKNGGEGE